MQAVGSKTILSPARIPQDMGGEFSYKINVSSYEVYPFFKFEELQHLNAES